MKTSSVWEAPPCQGMCMNWTDLEQIQSQMFEICKALLNDKKLLDALRSSNFDIVYSEYSDLCAPGIWQVINVKNFVLVSAVGMTTQLYNVAGFSTLPSFMPVVVTPFSDEMSFLERMINFNLELVIKYYSASAKNKYWRLFDNVYPGFPSFDQILEEKTTLLMTNVNEFAETARPTINMIKYIGGSAIREPKPLPENLSVILDKNPVNVLFSMGSLVQSKNMPDSLKKDIIETFASFPKVTFIWKYESDDYNDVFKAHSNILPMKWVPQIDLLADPRLTLFITHGGLNSILETMNFGKPVIVIPVFADQQLNSKNVERNGLGIVLARHNLNKDTLREALEKAIGNKEMVRKAALVASLLDGAPKKYRQEIANWARIIAEHGQLDHLKLYSRRLNWFQYYCLDVVAFELFIAVLILSFLVCILRRLVKYLRCSKVKSE